MRKNKIISFVMMAVMFLTIACTSTMLGCGKDSYDPDAIQISIAKLGYGTEWLHEIADAYTEKTGNKVQITEEIGQEGNSKISTAVQSLTSKIDIAFVESSAVSKFVYEGSVSVQGTKYDCLLTDITDVYNSTMASGSTATIKSQMESSFENYANFDNKYYFLPWAGGISGIVVNMTKFTDLGFESKDLPTTTDELFALCDQIVGKTCAPFIYASSDEYYTMFMPVWFAQYEGRESMAKFLAGKDPDGNVSEFLYTYEGQRAMLEVMEQLIKPSNNYQDSVSTEVDFSTMQGYFLSGRSPFCVNGSWLETEMSNYTNINIDFFKTPVISSIIEHEACENTIADDNELSALIKAIDNGSDSLTGTGYDVSQSAYNKVKEARNIAYMKSGSSAVAYIPCYSTKINQAKDFLKFMYSDEGLNIYYKTLNGITLPVKPVNGYNSESVNPSNFRKTINNAEQLGLGFDYTSKARIYVLGGVDKNFRNGTTTVVTNFRNGVSVDAILSSNNSNIEQNWVTIRKYL